ncbi:hypothetical protein ACFQRB_18250 [Halobaculum litoreum]|uniref:Uncharacterized protein n=1 Tax=Halobaculum litoreum TaxID=3031998 RepID=A0ABD5XVW3_9EURY
MAVPATALDGRPPSAAPTVARELAADGDLEAVVREHVADARRPWEYLEATEWCLAGTDSPDGDGFDGIETAIEGDAHPDAELDGPGRRPRGRDGPLGRRDRGTGPRGGGRDSRAELLRPSEQFYLG